MYWITGILGLVLALAPFTLGYSENSIALWVSLSLGFVVMTLSYYEAYSIDRERWEYIVTVVAGIVSMIAPFVLGFGNQVNAMVTSVGIGFLLAVSAGARLFYSSQNRYE
ncbi:MAG: SPW repeat protein [Candidatus Levybacteria bacterium]|nr:SPW repeat protein [Candidatus Levybacteria bacterium]